MTASERDQLVQALHSAYHNVSELEQLVLLALGQRLEDLAPPGTLAARTLALVQWAEATGRLDELIRAAHDRRPGNPRMRAVRERLATGGGPHTILFLAANPRGTGQLALDEECAAVERELRMTAGRDGLQFRSKWAVTVDDLMRHLRELRPTVIHFSGHGQRASGEPAAGGRDAVADGDASAGIQLQDEQRNPRLVTARALTRMIAAAAPAARLVVLNACFTNDVADPLCDVVDCVVGMRGAIDDRAARSFAVTFYGALGDGASIENAVEQAVATLDGKQLPDHLLPVCRTRDGVRASEIRFASPP